MAAMLGAFGEEDATPPLCDPELRVQRSERISRLAWRELGETLTTIRSRGREM